MTFQSCKHIQANLLFAFPSSFPLGVFAFLGQCFIWNGNLPLRNVTFWEQWWIKRVNTILSPVSPSLLSAPQSHIECILPNMLDKLAIPGWKLTASSCSSTLLGRESSDTHTQTRNTGYSKHKLGSLRPFMRLSVLMCWNTFHITIIDCFPNSIQV